MATEQMVAFITLTFVMLLSLALWGRSWVLRRREEEELRPYRARWEKRRELRRSEKEQLKQTRRSAVLAGDDGDEQLMERLKKVGFLHRGLYDFGCGY